MMTTAQRANGIEDRDANGKAIRCKGPAKEALVHMPRTAQQLRHVPKSRGVRLKGRCAALLSQCLAGAEKDQIGSAVRVGRTQ